MRLSVAEGTLILNQYSAITAQTRRSDSAAATPGRRNTKSQAKLARPQASRKSPTWNGSRSPRQRMMNAAACGPATTETRARDDPTAGWRLLRRSAPGEVIDMGDSQRFLISPA